MRAPVVLLACLFWVAGAVSAQTKTQEPPSKQGHAPEVYTGTIMALSGLLAGRPTDLAVVMGRVSTPAELLRYHQTLDEKDGQKKLADALGNEYDLGAYRLGSELSLAVKIISSEKVGNTRHVVLVGVRIPQGLESQGQLTPRDYRFVMIKLNLDEKGNGEGEYLASVKLRFNKDNVPEVADYQTQPARVLEVKAQRR